MTLLSPEKGLIFRITHVRNIPWILANGLHCSSSGHADPNYVAIGNAEIITRRATRVVPIAPGGVLGDYVPFYFTPRSPMLYNIKSGFGVPQRPMSEIGILVSSLPELRKQGLPFVFTDRHAVLATAEFHDSLERLGQIDWARLQASDFKRDPDDPGKFERYQAEALVHRHVPLGAVLGIICCTVAEQTKIESICATLNPRPKVLCRPDWYF